MITDNDLRLLASIILYISTPILSFALFKIPIKANHKVITLLALTLGTLSFYLKFELHTPMFSLFILVFYIVLLMLLKNFPFFYSFIICGVSYFIYGIIDAIGSFIAEKIGYADLYLINTDTKHFVVMQLIVSASYLFIAWLLVKLNLGFAFMVRRFKLGNALKLHNFIWGIILISGIILVQIISFQITLNSIHGIVLISLFLVSVIVIIYSYIQNKKSVREREGKK